MAAGSSSSAGGDGLSLLSHCVPSYTAYAIELETFALVAKKRKEILLDLCTVSILDVNNGIRAYTRVDRGQKR